MMVIYRYSHEGKVCSGDYADYYPVDILGNYEIYEEYYLISEGRFLKWYSYAWFMLLGFSSCCCTCVGSIILIGTGY